MSSMRAEHMVIGADRCVKQEASSLDCYCNLLRSTYKCEYTGPTPGSDLNMRFIVICLIQIKFQILILDRYFRVCCCEITAPNVDEPLKTSCRGSRGDVTGRHKNGK